MPQSAAERGSSGGNGERKGGKAKREREGDSGFRHPGRGGPCHVRLPWIFTETKPKFPSRGCTGESPLAGRAASGAEGERGGERRRAGHFEGQSISCARGAREEGQARGWGRGAGEGSSLDTDEAQARSMMWQLPRAVLVGARRKAQARVFSCMDVRVCVCLRVSVRACVRHKSRDEKRGPADKPRTM